MNKDKVIEELNEINKELSRQIDEYTANQGKLVSDLRKTCIRDIIPLNMLGLPHESESHEIKLRLSKSSGNNNAIDENKEHDFSRAIFSRVLPSQS